jgi:hypothetical protein
VPDFDRAGSLARIDFTGTRIDFAAPGRLHWTSETQTPIRLRALRKIAEETKNHDLERDLYIEERKAERGVFLYQQLNDLGLSLLKEKLEYIHKKRRRNVARLAYVLKIPTKPVKFARLITHLLWIAVMGVFWALAGRSFIRPAAWLIASVFFFYWCYGKILAPLMEKASSPDVDKYKQAVRMLALGNAVPFVGPLTIDTKIKEFLFCPGSSANPHYATQAGGCSLTN